MCCSKGAAAIYGEELFEQATEVSLTGRYRVDYDSWIVVATDRFPLGTLINSGFAQAWRTLKSNPNSSRYCGTTGRRFEAAREVRGVHRLSYYDANELNIQFTPNPFGSSGSALAPRRTYFFACKKLPAAGVEPAAGTIFCAVGSPAYILTSWTSMVSPFTVPVMVTLCPT